MEHKWIHHDATREFKTCDKCRMTVIPLNGYYTWSLPGGLLSGDTQSPGSTIPGCLGSTPPEAQPKPPMIPRTV